MRDGKRSQVTRKDRSIGDEAWIADFLRRAPSGVIATSMDGQPYASTLLFACTPDARSIYIHTARRGRVWENILSNPRVCFTATRMGRLLPAETALNFSVEYEGVVVFGQAVLVEDPVEAENALQILLEKYFPHLRPERDYRPITLTELDATAVFRIDVEEWSGKRKSVPEDFPGAIIFGDKNPEE